MLSFLKSFFKNKSINLYYTPNYAKGLGKNTDTITKLIKETPIPPRIPQ